LIQRNTSNVRIVAYVLEDPADPKQKKFFDDAFTLYDQLFIEEEKDGKDALLSGISGGDGRKAPWVVAVDQNTGTVVGGTVVTVFHDRPLGTLGYHFTDKRLRGRGIGRLLQETALNYVKSFNEQKPTPSDITQIKILADIENPAKMSFRDILVTTVKADIDPWARVRFWERLGFLPVVSGRTGEPFPFIVIPDAEDAEPTCALDLWVKLPWAETQPAGFAFDTKEITQDVLFWLFGTAELDRSTYRPPFNNPAIDEMIAWHETHLSATPSGEYLLSIRGSAVGFNKIIANYSEKKGAKRGIRNIDVAEEWAAKAVSEKLRKLAAIGLDAGDLDVLDSLWEQYRSRELDSSCHHQE
jgi:GNAT superfamily N-acetyltransferase